MEFDLLYDMYLLIQIFWYYPQIGTGQDFDMLLYLQFYVNKGRLMQLCAKSSKPQLILKYINIEMSQ